MIATVRRGALFALTALAVALPAAAKADPVTPPSRPDTTAAVATDLGPTTSAAAVAVRARPDATHDAVAMQQRAGLGRPMALMIVGLGALIVGSLIGHDVGTIIMIGGAGIGLWGLYQYLQ